MQKQLALIFFSRKCIPYIQKFSTYIYIMILSLFYVYLYLLLLPTTNPNLLFIHSSETASPTTWSSIDETLSS